MFDGGRLVRNEHSETLVTMESPLVYPESPLDIDEAYPCKGCGEVWRLHLRH